MKKKRMWLAGFRVMLMLVFLGAVQPSLSQAGGPTDNIHMQSPAAYDYTDQLIVKYRNQSLVRTTAANNSARFMINERVDAMSSLAGVGLTHFRFMSGDGHVLKLPRRMTLAEATAVARKLTADPIVEYAEPDTRMFPMLTPNDPQYANQWHYKAPASEIGGANLPGAWDITTGSSSIVVAVVDTGIVAHADLTGRTVAGYNFISDAWMAGNGVGRSADPSDLGDWVVADDCYSGSNASNSSWHGTHVAGTIGAATNNSVGVAGINGTSKILPVRVLGKCGGYTSDIVDGMRWAAGIAVSGVPANGNPAKVMNLSLGGSGACSSTWQTAIDNITAAGATIVVAAGNTKPAGANAVNFSPANCNGVISVAATDRTGGRAYYSNYGTSVKIAAPGGAQSYINDPNGVLSTLNTGTTTPVASPSGDTYIYYQGTSMATPHVAGIASLLLSVNPNLLPVQVLALIQQTARVFPTGTTGTGGDCTTLLCGSGIIDAAAAVTLANNSVAFSARADLSLSLTSTAPTSPVVVGNSFTYQITVTNNAATNSTVATAVTFIQSGTATIGLASATPSTGTCTGTSFVTCNLGTLLSGASVTVTFTGTPITGGTIIHTASASSAMTDLNLTNNSWKFTGMANNPVPVISSISPSSVTAGSTGGTLIVNGSNFSGDSTVQWGGNNRPTSFVSFTQLAALISSADIATAGAVNVTVVNPAPGGGTSNTVTFTTNAPPPQAPPGGGGGGGCFIATAAFGSPLERHVQILRDFRDRILLNSSVGKAFVDFYYRTSPAIADKIAQSNGLRFITRIMLMPVICVAYLIIHWGLPASFLLLTMVLFTVIFTIWIFRKKIRKAAQAKASV
jgi:serine protease